MGDWCLKEVALELVDAPLERAIHVIKMSQMSRTKTKTLKETRM